MKKVNATVTIFSLILPVYFLPLIANANPATSFHRYSESGSSGIILYTPYISRSVTPGKNLNYSIQIINKTGSIQVVGISVRGLPGSWNPTFTAGTNTIQEIAVMPKTLASKNSSDVDLSVNVPLKIKKGIYDFKLIARTKSGLEDVFPLRVRVTKEGTFETELHVKQANMEGYANSNLNYTATLNNRTAEQQNYALTASAPPGWDVRFRVNGNFATSVNLASNKNQEVYIQVKPSPNVKAGTYNITIQATSGNTSARTTLQSVIKGKYKMQLTTPSGRVSTDVTAGGKRTVKLLVRNTGSVQLRNIKLNASPPENWTVSFDHQQISELAPGDSRTITATIKASSKAIAGDYELQMNASAPEASSSASFRITVNQSMLWGSVGIFIILLVAGSIIWTMKKYGRR